jgi:hypothetical protein
MKLKKFLKPLETAGLKCNIYTCYKKGEDFEEELVYIGSMRDIPYWIVNYEIGFCDNDPDAVGLDPISWTHGLKQSYNDNEDLDSQYQGFCIYLKEEQK